MAKDRLKFYLSFSRSLANLGRESATAGLIGQDQSDLVLDFGLVSLRRTFQTFLVWLLCVPSGSLFLSSLYFS